MNKFTQLIKVIKKGDIEKAAEILQETTLNINELDPKSGKGVIHLAMENADLEMFKILITYPGINPELPSKDGEYPLETAIRLNDLAFVNKLLQLKINPRRKNQFGQNAFAVAIKNQTSPDILRKLINSKFDVDERIEEHGCYLNLAIKESQPENVLFLLKEPGIKYNTTDETDNTCLILAVQHGKGDLVVAILEKLRDDPSLTAIEKQFFINAQNKEGNTALHLACLKNLQTITERIELFGKDFGLDASLKNKKGQTAESIKFQVEKDRLAEMELNQRRKEERVVKKKQKQEQKMRIRTEQDRDRKAEAKRKKQEEERLLIESRVKKEYNKKRMAWIAGIVFIVLLGLMYVAMLNQIEKKKALESPF